MCWAALLLASLSPARLTAAETRLWHDAPATHFTESTPLGNGRLGAMVFGGVGEERIVLNETGMWSGSPQEADRPDAHRSLPEIRRLLLAGKNVEAEALVNANFTSAGVGSGRGVGANVPFGCYQTLGNLRLTLVGAAAGAEARDYRRELNLADATARISYEQAGVRYQREIFVSSPDDVIVVRLTADRPGMLSFDATLDRPENATLSDAGYGVLMSGQLPDGKNGATGVRYAARLHAVLRGAGDMRITAGGLQIRRADEVILFVAAVTDIRTFAGRRADDPALATTGDVLAAAGQPYADLRAAHVADYRRYFDRVTLRLGAANPALAAKPVTERLRLLAAGAADPGLAALYFDFGRYLLISSSRPGGLPANLQGLWAEEIQTPWNGDWHLNVNVQMNYWPAEVCALPELAEPLFKLIESLQKPGARTAQSYYGARGWVAHVITNPWGFTSPGEQASWGASYNGSAWLCQHLWDHFRFNNEWKFLAWAHPILKGASQFYLDALIEEPAHRWLVTAPSNSPENSFRMPDGRVAHVAMGPTVDQQMLRYLFDATASSANLLMVDEDLISELRGKIPRLAPTRIGSDGRVMEWLEEYAEPEPQHRHVSHLWGLYPGHEISPQRTPELAAAARKTLEARGDAGTGWSLAFKQNLWARLHDGDRAERILRRQLRPVPSRPPPGQRGEGGTYPNLFDAHPPFQIDGNFGAAAGIAEMLLQSHAGELHFLPALPAAWAEGEVTGLRARPGLSVDLAWRDGRLTRAVVRSTGGVELPVRYGGRVVPLTLVPGQVATFDGELRATITPAP